MNLAQQKHKEKSRRYFDKSAFNYELTWDGQYCQQMYAQVLEKISEQPFESLLDVGCGSGVMLAILGKEQPHMKACGIDLSEQMIKQAQIKLGTNADLRVGDADNLPWNDDIFDLAVCNAAFHHYPNPIQSLKEMYRVLKPGGRLVIADPWWPKKLRQAINYYLQSPFNTKGDVRIYSPEEMEQMLDASGFKHIDWELVARTYFIVTAVTESYQ
ncbi:MAG TPA: methyltransferase domain-containing protein [Syntrophomonas sp.]|nr:methyltransferase domain-containing protein [Syntrophomonas sp.]